MRRDRTTGPRGEGRARAKLKSARNGNVFGFVGRAIKARRGERFEGGVFVSRTKVCPGMPEMRWLQRVRRRSQSFRVVSTREGGQVTPRGGEEWWTSRRRAEMDRVSAGAGVVGEDGSQAAMGHRRGKRVARSALVSG
jgi:hypothetical protein